MLKTDRIRLGIVGCGVVAGYGHGPALASVEEFEIVAALDPSFAASEAFATRFGGKPFSDEAAFYAQPLDAIVVASPLGTHKHHVLRAADRGLHALCEKPIAPNDADAREMAQAMESSGRVLSVGFVYRHSHVTTTLRAWIAEGLLGEVRLARLSYLWSLHGRYERSEGVWVESPRWRGRMEEGGPLVDCGVHFLDLAMLFLGEIHATEGFGAWLADYDAPDYILATSEHAGGRSVVEVGFSYGHTAKDPSSMFTYDLIGTGGTARYDRTGWLLERRNGEATIQVPGASEKNFDEMYRAFARRIRGEDEPLLASPQAAATATRWANVATEQAIARRHRFGSNLGKIVA